MHVILKYNCLFIERPTLFIFVYNQEMHKLYLDLCEGFSSIQYTVLSLTNNYCTIQRLIVLVTLDQNNVIQITFCYRNLPPWKSKVVWHLINYIHVKTVIVSISDFIEIVGPAIRSLWNFSTFNSWICITIALSFISNI